MSAKLNQQLNINEKNYNVSQTLFLENNTDSSFLILHFLNKMPLKHGIPVISKNFFTFSMRSNQLTNKIVANKAN